MKINTNSWNKLRYTLWAPGYDWVARLLAEARKKSLSGLNVQPGETVLIVGAGTGLDLEFLPKDALITATDLTPAMLARVAKRAHALDMNVNVIVMDGQQLEFPDNSFDKAILHLILAVIPDPYRCIKEVARVLKPGGTVTIYDKFVPKGNQVSFTRKLANFFTNLIASDITRDFESILEYSGLQLLSDEDAGLNGNFRILVLKKDKG